MEELNRVMCVEDEADIQAVVKMTLEKLGGFTVTSCTSGQDALDRLAESRPQLILLDVMMPGMDGPTTLEAMRGQEGFADTPIAFMTARVQPNEVAHYRSLGAVDVIFKPFDPMKLVDEVRAVWEKAGA